MTDDPIADADAHLERIDAESERREKYEVFYRQTITETLTKTLRTVAHQSLCLPTTQDGKISNEPLRSAIADHVSYSAPLTALMEVLAGSDCPLVAKLRQALADSYSDANADDLAEASL